MVMTSRRSTQDQFLATDPRASAWVSASAGTGKTHVLANRVLRLMLSGTPPQRILCLTYTRAAAAQMANRINQTLGRWTVGESTDLAAELSALNGEDTDEDTVMRARRLFAQVLDVPGGLNIQTLHSFCQSL
ncbi:MAG: UvrD-helicase domain-containing protein, partial [Rhodospirillales bacterium]|nr:UvrD-helicase domain-containing protein [Rhodospirillales bacterium]